MKLICLKDNLKKGVNLAERLVGKNLTLPILSNFLLDTEKGNFRINATDLELGINVVINAKVEKEGQFTVPAKIFSGIVNNLTEDKLTLEVKEKHLKISSKNHNFQINGLDAKDFPLLPRIEKESNIELGAETLRRAFSQVAPAASFSETRPELAGIYLKIEKNQLKIAATDSFRLAEKIIQKDFKTNVQNPTSLIIPLRVVQEIIRVVEGQTSAVIKFTKNQLMVSVENVNLIGRLIEGEYPEYEQIIPRSHQTKIILNKEEFVNAIRLASLFSSKVNDVKINFDSDRGLLEVLATDTERGQANTNLKIKTEGQSGSLTFNYRYLLDGLGNIADEEVALEFNGESAPTVMRPISEEAYLYLIMPIKSI